MDRLSHACKSLNYNLQVLVSPASVPSRFIFEENVTRLFQDLDTDNSGMVKREEFVQALMRVTEGSSIQDRHLLVRLEKLCLAIATAAGVGIPRGEQGGHDSQFLRSRLPLRAPRFPTSPPR